MRVAPATAHLYAAAMVSDLARGTRVVLATAFGSVLIAAGLVMLLTPGPGVLSLAAGTAILSRHHHWAARARAAVVARFPGRPYRTPRTPPAPQPDQP